MVKYASTETIKYRIEVSLFHEIPTDQDITKIECGGWKILTICPAVSPSILEKIRQLRQPEHDSWNYNLDDVVRIIESE